jgi:hypothetical protein
MKKIITNLLKKERNYNIRKREFGMTLAVVTAVTDFNVKKIFY